MNSTTKLHEEHVKLHHRDATHKIHTAGNPTRQITQLLQRVNCQGQRKRWRGEVWIKRDQGLSASHNECGSYLDLESN